MTPPEVPIVAVYAGDTLLFPPYSFQTEGVPTDLVAEGWGDWSAAWRVNIYEAEFISLAVDASDAAAGVIAVSATAAQTRLMDGPGVWDIQAVRGAEVRTFLRGKTSFKLDVTHE